MSTAHAKRASFFDRMISRMLPAVPRRIVRRLSRPYIAGTDRNQAAAIVRELAAKDFTTTVDVLGESVLDKDQAIATADEYVAMLDELAREMGPEHINVSVKLTALGLSFDQQLAQSNLTRIVEHARSVNGFVRIDMEDSPYTDQTLAMYRSLRDAGYDNTGVVIQSYLKRSDEDIARLAGMGARVRLVKGIYIEPEEIAWTDMAEINRSYVRLSRALLSAGCHVAFATHDDELIRQTAQLVNEYDTPRDMYEYQMLLGVREELRDQVQADGHPLRVYIPYGAQWYEYSVRRLRENPKIAGYVFADIMRSIFRRKRAGNAGQMVSS